MGIDYSSTTGYGFKVDKDALTELMPEVYVSEGYWEVMEKFCQQFKTLSFAAGNDYDAEPDFAILVKSQSRSSGYQTTTFGVFVLEDPFLTAEEEEELNLAYTLVGSGTVAAVAVFACF